MVPDEQTKQQQIARFRETARVLGCDEDKEKFEATLGKIASHKPSSKPKKSNRNKNPQETQ
jgi:hypothetical protein